MSLAPDGMLHGTSSNVGLFRFVVVATDAYGAQGAAEVELRTLRDD
jgi:hypothetical protein